VSAFSLELSEALLDEIVSLVVDRVHQAPERRYLSKSALADRLGVKPRTIETWRSKGLPGRRVGREVMYSVEECERWIERHP
jgi:ribosome-binding protein aMBF1 (putative translation factor)